VALEYEQLMSQSEDLDVLLDVAHPTDADHLDETTGQQIEERQGHGLPAWSASKPRSIPVHEYLHPSIRVIKTPVRSPRANAYSERWVRTVRAESLDHMLILGSGHPERVLRQFVSHYNEQRPHRAIGLGVPAGSAGPSAPTLDVRRHDVLGGLIHEYHPAAA
jgi:hypothetical protein